MHILCDPADAARLLRLNGAGRVAFKPVDLKPALLVAHDSPEWARPKRRPAPTPAGLFPRSAGGTVGGDPNIGPALPGGVHDSAANDAGSIQNHLGLRNVGAHPSDTAGPIRGTSGGIDPVADQHSIVPGRKRTYLKATVAQGRGLRADQHGRLGGSEAGGGGAGGGR